MTSKLDGILKFNEPNSWESDQKVAKQQIKDLMLELIGEDEAVMRYTISREPVGARSMKCDIRNKLRAELRRKVEEL
jgi:hypothetical protein